MRGRRVRWGKGEVGRLCAGEGGGGGGAGLPSDTTLSHERGTNTYCRPAKQLSLR